VGGVCGGQTLLETVVVWLVVAGYVPRFNMECE
jgi:hypothetical protein